MACMKSRMRKAAASMTVTLAAQIKTSQSSLRSQCGRAFSCSVVAIAVSYLTLEHAV